MAQEFGTFSGEDIGNNKPSLLPQLPGASIQKQEQNLSQLLSLSSSEPILQQDELWDVTLWIALNDIDESMGPLQFMKGSHKRRYPLRMGSLVESDFWQNPFANIKDKTELVNACNNSYLVLDVDTSKILNNIDLTKYSFEELKNLIIENLQVMKGSITCVDEVNEKSVVNLPIKKGDYIIFSERTMHGSLPNVSDKDRLAINFRITRSSTLIYPLRLQGDFIDGFNLDISKHSSVLLAGQNLNSDNVVKSLSEYSIEESIVD